MEIERKIELITTNDKVFKLDLQDIKYMNTLKLCLEDCLDENYIQQCKIPILITEKIFNFVVDFINLIKKYEPDRDPMIKNKYKIILSEWQISFIQSMNEDELFQVINAANYLEFNYLLDITLQHVANELSKKSIDEIENMFELVDPLTDDEEKQLRNELFND